MKKYTILMLICLAGASFEIYAPLERLVEPPVEPAPVEHMGSTTEAQRATLAKQATAAREATATHEETDRTAAEQKTPKKAFQMTYKFDSSMPNSKIIDTISADLGLPLTDAQRSNLSARIDAQKSKANPSMTDINKALLELTLDLLSPQDRISETVLIEAEKLGTSFWDKFSRGYEALRSKINDSIKKTSRKIATGIGLRQKSPTESMDATITKGQTKLARAQKDLVNAQETLASYQKSYESYLKSYDANIDFMGQIRSKGPESTDTAADYRRFIEEAKKSITDKQAALERAINSLELVAPHITDPIKLSNDLAATAENDLSAALDAEEAASNDYYQFAAKLRDLQAPGATITRAESAQLAKLKAIIDEKSSLVRAKMQIADQAQAALIKAHTEAVKPGAGTRAVVSPSPSSSYNTGFMQVE